MHAQRAQCQRQRALLFHLRVHKLTVRHDCVHLEAAAELARKRGRRAHVACAVNGAHGARRPAAVLVVCLRVDAVAAHAEEVEVRAVLLKPSARDARGIRDDGDGGKAALALGVAHERAEELRVQEGLAAGEVHLLRAARAKRVQYAQQIVERLHIRRLSRVEAVG